MKMKSLIGLFAIVVAAGLAGCGGGGGGGGGTPAPPFTINGTVLNGDSTIGNPDPANNVTVLFDDKNTLEATTIANGTYTIVVPAAQVTGSDKLWLTDGSGNVLDVAPIVVNATPLTPTTTLPNSPPAQPPLVVRAK